MNETVIRFEEGKLMQVTFSSELINLVNEVRQVTSMGYNVHPSIIQAASIAQNFTSQARALNQVFK